MTNKMSRSTEREKQKSALPKEKIYRVFEKTRIPKDTGGKVQLAQIVVAQATAIPLEKICAPTRSKPVIAQARQIAMYLTHVALGVSLTQTAAGFGRDRTTASHACKVVEELRDDPKFDFQLSQLEEGLAKIALRSLEPQ
jgi:chromosomal replication initiation ATPase DnaA